MDNKEKFDQEVLELADEMTYHSYSLRKLSGKKLFYKMTAADYVALEMLLKKEKGKKEENGTIGGAALAEGKKLYLQDIAEMLKLSIGQVSRLARTLQERGLIVWKHDGNGDEGTYIQITDKGMNSAQEQQERLRNFYAGIIKKYGNERFKLLIEQIKELEDIMSDEID